MKYFFFAAALLLTSVSAQAGMDLYAGAGLATGQMQLEQANNKSTFHKFSYFLEGGFLFQFSTTFEVIVGAEYGISHSYNNVEATDYLETASNSFATGKAGFAMSGITVGGGLRRVDMDVKSVSTNNGAIENNYKGDVPMYFLSYTFEMGGGRGGNFRTVVELQHVDGKIDDLTYVDTSLSLNLAMTLGR